MSDNIFYFTAHDHETLHGVRNFPETSSAVVWNIAERVGHLQRGLSRRLAAMGSDLQPCWDRQSAVNSYSFSMNEPFEGLAAAFVRPRTHATLVEKMMGRGTTGIQQPQSYRHPVLELRVTPDHIALELIMSPYAWWDQQNFVGKMGIDRHRAAFRSILCDGTDSMYLGFWMGESLCDVHLTCRQVLRGHFLEEWFGTFAAEHDWFRIGVWYEPESPALTQDNIITELSQRLVTLSKLYSFFAWTSDNNFHGFNYNGRRAPQGDYASI